MNDSDFSRLLTRYIIGFGLSLLLSVVSYAVVTNRLLDSAEGMMAVLLALAVVQLFVQLICFLHLGLKGRSAGRSATLGFTVAMMLVIVIGSLWIMKNLDYRMGMSGESMNEYMLKQNEKGF
jgi:cytochrome o ubiquinol oxidase operon protein cyoD